jgi:predicted transcriptional regulator
MPRAAAARELPPPLELLCLNALWSLGEGSVKAVQGAVSSRRTLAYTTVMTLLDRLARKGLAGRRKVGRAFVYTPQIGRDALRRIALREFLDAYFDGSAAGLREFLEGRPAESPAAPPAEEAEPEPGLETVLL